jgi:hypothetical protein
MEGVVHANGFPVTVDQPVGEALWRTGATWSSSVDIVEST